MPVPTVTTAAGPVNSVVTPVATTGTNRTIADPPVTNVGTTGGPADVPAATAVTTVTSTGPTLLSARSTVFTAGYTGLSGGNTDTSLVFPVTISDTWTKSTLVLTASSFGFFYVSSTSYVYLSVLEVMLTVFSP